jgi:D-tyrosyl-tRNA(Tyr) deacylase
VGNELIGAIGPGLLALVGVTHGDGPAQMATLSRKIAELRLLRGERSVSDDPGSAILVVSQFTLYGDVRKGRRPSWSAAAPAAEAAQLIDALVSALRERGITVATGQFGADMRVESVNDGPVTIIIDS